MGSSSRWAKSAAQREEPCFSVATTYPNCLDLVNGSAVRRIGAQRINWEHQSAVGGTVVMAVVKAPSAMSLSHKSITHDRNQHQVLQYLILRELL